MIAGTISIDLPEPSSDHRYTCSGTQHYIAFVYIKAQSQLYLFDSASKNPIRDHNEINDILYYTLGEPTLSYIPFPYVLQPGAGDRSTENPRSYNNQNVFCHTWTLWFLTHFFLHYNPATPEASEAQLAQLAHSSERQNLAMIKRFAIDLLPFIYEPPSPSRIAAKFPIRAYKKAVERNDLMRLHSILTNYIKYAEPMTGLGYIYDAKHRKVIPIMEV
jgi:hypothetical protein